MPSGSPRGSIGTNTIGNVSTLSGGIQSGGAWGYTDGRSGGESQINNGPITITGGSRGDPVSAAVARNMASTARAGSANAAIGVNNSTTADRNTAYTGGSGGALGTIGSGGSRPVTNFASSASGPLVPGRSPDPGVIGVAGGVSGRMAPAFANRFNFVGGAKARGGSNPLGGLTTPAVGQLIGFADHLRSQGMMDPLNVTSAYRSQAVQDSLRKANPKSAALGRIAKNSAHTKGTAIDITHPGMSNAQLAAQVASYPGFNTMMGYESASNPQGSHIHVEAGEGPLRGLGSVGGKKVASIVSGAPRPSAPIQTASLGPIAMSAPRIGTPPIPQRNPMRTGIPTPQPKPIGPQISSLGTPVPQMAPGGFFPSEIDAARNARPAPPSTFAGSGQPSYSAQQAPQGPSAPNAAMIARAYSEYARQNERRYDVPAMQRQLNQTSDTPPQGGSPLRRGALPAAPPMAQGPIAPSQIHPDRMQELAARRLTPQSLVNTRSATAVEGWQPQNFTPPQMPSRPMVGVDSLPPSLRKKDQEQVPGTLSGIGRPIDVADLSGIMGTNLPNPPGLQNMPEMEGLPPADFSTSTQYKTPAAPPISTAPQGMSANAATGPENYTSPPEFDAPLNYLRDRYEKQRAAPKTHEIQQPGQVPGRPSQIADASSIQDRIGNVISQGVRKGREILDSNWWKATGKRNAENTSLAARFRGTNERRPVQISRLARALIEQGEADSQREARELAENILDYSRITYS
jgi:hypothetical protein